jgi:predicted MPP superfamily phosphohydrolase
VRVEHAGASIDVTGLAPVRPARMPTQVPLPAPEANLDVILALYPEVFDHIDPERRCVVLAGHLHGGQICLPRPGGRLRLSQRGRRYTEGVYRRGRVTMHVSRGTGTTFVPFRVLARPEVTMLVLDTERAL